jgi:hypothetical protein
MKRLIFFVPLFLLCGCYYATTNTTNAPLTQEENGMPHTSAAYEMYSWYNGENWAYALLESTVGIATFDDITNSPDIIIGTEGIAQSFKTLPRGAKVYWNLKRIKGFALPDQNTEDKLVSAARKAGIQLEIIAWP